jgi:signal transduction histidine kinase
MCLPLLVRGDVLGAMTLGTEDGSRRFQDEDLALAQEIALRAATAVDNGQLYQKTQEAVRLRDEFLSVASHELTTPMAALLPTLEALIADVPEVREGSEQLRRMVGLAERQGRRLKRLIAELLDTTQLTRGAPALRLDRADLGATVRDTIERQQPEITRARCVVELDLEPGVHGRWDAGRLEQVVVNLLSNALKFGGGQSIEIRVRGHGATASLTVTDHGIGMTPERQKRIFERFERGVSAEHYGGLGLGLYIARRIVDAHGGSISVASRLGAGSTFTVTLPSGGPPMVTPEG